MPRRDSRKLEITEETTIASTESREAASPRRSLVEISQLATSQDGLVSTDQLRNLGLSSGRITELCKMGFLHRVRRRAYSVGRRALPERGHIRAVTVALAGRCIVSHHTAAYLWGIAGRTRPIHVLRPKGARRELARVRSHRVASLATVPHRHVRDLPVTTVTRTLRDLAAFLSLEDLEDLVARAQRRGILVIPDLRAEEEPNRSRPGAPAFRKLLGQIDPDVLATRSRMERRILRLCAKAGLPRPQAAAVVAGYEVDLFWAEERLIVEFDGRAYHSDVSAFERDHRRDARHLAAGYRTFRITFRMFDDDPDAVVAQIAALLDRGRRETGSRTQ